MEVNVDVEKVNVDVEKVNVDMEKVNVICELAIENGNKVSLEQE